MTTNEKRAIDLAQARYGKGTTIRNKMEAGKAVWWVDHGQHDHAVAAGSLLDLIRLLTPASTAPSMGQEMKDVEDNSMVSSRQAADMLKVTPGAVLGMLKDGRLKAAGMQSGKGGRHWLFRRADVEAYIGKMMVRRARRAPKNPKKPLVTGGAATRPDKRLGRSSNQLNIRNVPNDLTQRAEVLAARIRSKSVFTEYVTASQVIRAAIERGLPLLEKEHAK